MFQQISGDIQGCLKYIYVVIFKVYICCMFFSYEVVVLWYIWCLARVRLVFELAFYSIDCVLADFQGHSGSFERCSCGDIKGIHILHMLAYKF